MATTSVRATVGPKTLANVDRYFTNTFDGIMVELLANCRRAGASRVSVTLHPEGEVEVEDDGRGIPASEAGTLLSFGGSGNEEVVERDEAPAGMGFFSLARRGAVVASRDWSMHVPPEAFAGEGAARLVDGLPVRTGTSVRFPESGLLFEDEALGLAAATAAIATSMPFACLVNAVEVPRQTPLDRLTRAVGIARDEGCWAGVEEVIVDDCQVVVARLEATDAVSRRLGAELGWRGLEGGRAPDVVADVFGQVLVLADDGARMLAGGGDGDALETSVLVERDGRWREAWPTYFVVLHALGSRTLVPRLPDRMQLVETAGILEVARAARSVVTRLVAAAPRNALDGWVREAPGAVPVPSRQFVARGVVAYGGGGARNVVAVADGGWREAGLAEGLVALVDPGPEVESVVARARDLSRAGSALRRVVRTTGIGDGEGFGNDVVRSVEVELGGVWVLVARWPDGISEDLAEDAWNAVGPDAWIDDSYVACEVETIRVRLRTRSGRTIVGATDHVALGTFGGPLAFTPRVDHDVAADGQAWLHVLDGDDEEAIMEVAEEVSEAILARTAGEAGVIAYRVGKLLTELEPGNARKVEASLSEDGETWAIRVTDAEGRVVGQEDWVGH